MASPHFSPPFVARRWKVVPWLNIGTEECAGIVDTMLSALTEQISARARHSIVAVEGW